MYYRSNVTRVGAPSPQTGKPFTYPASVGGVNALDSIMAMPPQDCLYTYNLMPVEYGLRLRKGYTQWATGCGDGDIRTVLPYESQLRDAANDKLFCVTNEGIWDTTLYGTTSPTKDVTFAQTDKNAGYGVWCEFTNDSSRHFLFYADALNGLHQYEEAVGWSQPVGGVDPGEWHYLDPADGTTKIPFPVDNIAFIMVHKLRIWVVLEDSDDAWYLPLYSIAGELKKFTFGSKLVHGGRLMGLWNWTVDGGDGVDDYLLAVSRGGDVAMYRGSDPEQPDWNTTGTWFVGEVPNSRRVVAPHGGELYILSTYGITALSDLLQGVVSNELRSSPSAKVNRFLRADVESGKSFYEWSINIHPADGFMQVVTPEPTNTPFVQYNQNLATKAWGFWEGVPMICGATWSGDYFMGGKDGVLWLYDGVLDGTQLGGELGAPVEFRNLTSFQAPGSHSTFKRAGFIRTIGVLAGTAAINVKAVYDYKVDAQVKPPALVAPDSGTNLWDSALWDVNVWDFDSTGQSVPLGALGMGRTIAVATRGNSNTRLNIVGWDLIYTEGGLL